MLGTTAKCQVRTIGRAKEASVKPVAALQVEIPDWVTETPEDNTGYGLVMYVNGAGEQEVGLDRAEFVSLKAHLAKKRGYVAIIDVDATLASIAGKEVDGCGFTHSSQQLARQIIIARSIYRLCPEAVVTDDKVFAAALRDMADEVVPDYRIQVERA